MSRNGKRSFTVEQINKADQETALVIGEGFHQIVADALLAYKQPWNGKSNPAVASMGQFIRDCGRVLRGDPLDRFPMLQRMSEGVDGGIVVDESNYVEDDEVPA